MKIHYLLCGLPRSYINTIKYINNLFNEYSIIYYIIEDHTQGEQFAIDKLDVEYRRCLFNIQEFKHHIDSKYGKGYRYNNIDIQFYKVYKLFNQIVEYEEDDIVIRGRTDMLPFFNNSGLKNKELPEKGWKKTDDDKLVYDNGININRYNLKDYLYYIGLDYKKHPYHYMYDGWFMSDYKKIKILVECGIQYDNRFIDKSMKWKDGKPPEAQLLMNLLKKDIKLDTVSDISSCVRCIK